MTRSFPISSCSALIGGAEAVFVEKICHATDDAEIVVCDVAGKRCYVSQAEWTAGCKVFDVQSESAEIVTSNSSSAEKIALFRSLFRGRDDVYAGGYAKRGGGIGYGPVCENLWKQGICQKKSGKGVKCTECAAQRQ